MSNPFHGSVLKPAGSSRLSRDRFKIGVWVILVTVGFLVIGMLIEGCRARHSTPDVQNDAANTSATPELAATTNALPGVDTNAVSTASTNAGPEAVSTAAPPPPASELPADVSTPAATPGHAGSKSVYTVRRGDTLARIARTHGTTVKILKELNRLSGDRILVGQKLRLPIAR